MRVLSLFDGISCGQVALERLGLEVEEYYASEIDKSAIQVAKSNYPNTIEIGDVREVESRKYNGIDLMLFGSPCTNFSSSGNRKGMLTKDKEEILDLDTYIRYKEEGKEFIGQSYLFWEAIRILREVKPKYFLMENVKMDKKWEEIVSKELGVEPIEINSSLVSAQNRVRLYWTNIPRVGELEDKGIKLKDILEDKEWNKATIVGRRIDERGHRQDYNKEIEIVQCLEVRASNREKSNCLTTVQKDNVLTPMGIGRHIDVYGRKLPYRYYSRVEYERLQTLPEGYTDCVSESVAKRLIGNGWTVDVISYLLRGLSI